jgi:hypothetical protein
LKAGKTGRAVCDRTGKAYESQHGGTEWQMPAAALAIVISRLIVLFFIAQCTFI